MKAIAEAQTQASNKRCAAIAATFGMRMQFSYDLRRFASSLSDFLPLR